MNILIVKPSASEGLLCTIIKMATTVMRWIHERTHLAPTFTSLSYFQLANLSRATTMRNSGVLPCCYSRLCQSPEWTGEKSQRWSFPGSSQCFVIRLNSFFCSTPLVPLRLANSIKSPGIVRVGVGVLYSWCQNYSSRPCFPSACLNNSTWGSPAQLVSCD